MTARKLAAATAAAVTVFVGVVGGALVAPAAAHVTVQPPEAEKGGFAKLTFRTPNERDDASTTRLEVTFPADHPLFSVNVRPMQGWTASIERGSLSKPVEVFGEPRTDPVTKITWTGGEIRPGEFQEFEVSAGPLPEEADRLVFRAVQTYSSGEVVRWIDDATPGGPEAEHPAPVLRLVSAPGPGADEPDADADTGSAVSDGDEAESDGGSFTLAISAVVLGTIGALLGGTALVVAARKGSATPT